jgi:hypothetical protein
MKGGREREEIGTWLGGEKEKGGGVLAKKAFFFLPP